MPNEEINAAFQWKCQPEAENFVLNILNKCVEGNHFIASLKHDLLKHTSTRLFDWLDHVIVGYNEETEIELEKIGFVVDSTSPSYRVYRHPGAQLPAVILNDKDPNILGIAVSVESIADFLMVRGMTGLIEGTLFSNLRKCHVVTDNGISFYAIERRGILSMEPSYLENSTIEKYLEAKEKWQTRPRDMIEENEALSRTLGIAQEIVSLVGQNLAAWIILEAERSYWQSRNTAAQIQKNRQDRLGLGWANHDHHTFRSSRQHFSTLVRLFEILGFNCRERFYAGEEAGWGAQIMENPKCELILFLDVDLAPHEVEVNFAHHPLPELNNLGTIGLWCALHGDSILKGGMHHLEAQFMFDELTLELGHLGIGMMNPFSNFPYLKQAFTAGEIWQVDARRVEKILKSDLISPEQAEKFQKYGAVGSHLENLQRREGYKGFNQKNVSFIIKKTDPRTI